MNPAEQILLRGFAITGVTDSGEQLIITRGYVSGAAGEIPPTPPCRIYVVPAESRTYSVPAESRTYTVPCG